MVREPYNPLSRHGLHKEPFVVVLNLITNVRNDHTTNGRNDFNKFAETPAKLWKAGA